MDLTLVGAVATGIAAFSGLMALVREAETDDWQATAAGPLDGQTAHGRGAQPEQALRRLADELRRIRGPSASTTSPAREARATRRR